MATILLTGAGGFLGQHIAVRLAAAGYDVLGIILPGRPGPPERRGCSYLPVDLEQPGSAEVLIGCGQGVEAVVHFAAVLPTSLQSAGAVECGRRNRQLDAAVLAACERLECSLVYASTASIYPTDSAEWKNEHMRLPNCPPYAAEKLASEEEGLRRIGAAGRHFVGLRITAPYGPGQLARTVVRLFLERAFRNEPLEYFGSGAREQDFVYASDVAEAVWCALNHRVSGIFNIGSGEPTTMKDLAGMVVHAIPGCRSEVRANGAADPQELRYARIGIAAARDQLGWRPQTSLSEGLLRWASALQIDQQHANCVSL